MVAYELDFLGGSVVMKPCANAKDTEDKGSVLASGRSLGEGNGNQLQYSCLENSMHRGALGAVLHGVTKSQIQLSS